MIKKIGKAQIHVRYCVDPHGKITNVQFINTNDTVEQDTVLSVLERLQIDHARRIGDKPAWTCGLHTTINFYSHDRNGITGNLHHSSFDKLSAAPDTPEFLSAKPASLHLSIPQNTALPSKAKIKLTFCISPKGIPNRIHVVHANVKKLFNQAAMKTAKNWRFQPTHHTMCNVRQSVSFDIPHPSH